MSTRCQVIIKDDYETGELWFYRHSDGYPDGTLPTLYKFLDWVKSGKIRNNAEQSAGWLVILGHWEYNAPGTYLADRYPEEHRLGEPTGKHDQTGMGWKVGAYEPCSPNLHYDIEYLYTVDLAAKTITYKTGDELAAMIRAEVPE